MKSGSFATWAELLKFHAVWIVATILLCDVVALFAIYACHGDLWTNVRALACHGITPCLFPTAASRNGEGYFLTIQFVKFSKLHE